MARLPRRASARTINRHTHTHSRQFLPQHAAISSLKSVSLSLFNLSFGSLLSQKHNTNRPYAVLSPSGWQWKTVQTGGEAREEPPEMASPSTLEQGIKGWW